jgi:DMSO/TMAO reductase YedYZ molybdopterin-dependent catalytic subunit
MRRREFLARACALLGGGILLEGGRSPAVAAGSAGPMPQGPLPAPDGERGLLGLFPFADEPQPPWDTLIGSGEGARRFTNLADLPLDGSPPGNARFFVRTGPPPAPQPAGPWSLRFDASSPGKRAHLGLRSLEGLSRPQGRIVMECAGNDPGGGFGLLGAADWEGVPLGILLAKMKAKIGPLRGLDRIRVSGPGRNGASGGASDATEWIFSERQLAETGAFLALRMNGGPLSPENGHPARLLVPGWYGCACVKWVDRVSWVEEDAPATAHMRDYARRIGLESPPMLAREFPAASMGLSALPVRCEVRRSGETAVLRVVGLSWGGERAHEPLLIRMGRGRWDGVRYASRRRDRLGWSVWTYDWEPPAAGDYPIFLRPGRPEAFAPRLASGYHLRTVRIA